MRKGIFFHRTIIQSPEQRGEKTVGWATHYLIGIIFALLLTFAKGNIWLQYPTILPALLIGIVSVLAPFLLMQPCFGFGIAAAKTPAPWVSRGRSLIAHISCGIGLWLSALLLAFA